MQFSGIGYLPVLAAAAAGFVFGAGYYTALGNRWIAALGKTKADFEGGGMAGPLLVSAAAQLVIAVMLAGLAAHLGVKAVKGGMLTGVSVWLGFTITTVAVNYAWQRAKPMLTIIDGGHWLGVLLIQGAVVGAMA
jgi:hypothetical protein